MRKKNYARIIIVILDTVFVQSLEDLRKVRALNFQELHRLMEVLSARGLINDEWDDLTEKGRIVLMAGIGHGLLD